MQKTETNGVYSSEETRREELKNDFNQFENDCMTLSIFENLIGISEQCPVKLNNTLTQAFALLQAKQPNENHIKSLAVFTEMLLILSTYDDFIHREVDRYTEAYEAFNKFRDLRNGRF
ncbi:hypothetical protein [Flavobacterium algicola]|uniref:hypothetical protein n=1 Tax=Flavobacterium algicola TaxID=556529 RepID=UPI001EFC87F7|nr:hypothetical protein [Flavobacterium algicola]MCG9792479.1 hypothetical protein [Flavobacterium algicola]